MIHDTIHISPCLDFTLPVWHGGERHHDDEWPVDEFDGTDVFQEGDTLDGFAETPVMMGKMVRAHGHIGT